MGSRGQTKTQWRMRCCVSAWNIKFGLKSCLRKSWSMTCHRSPFKLLRWCDTPQGKAADIAWESHRDYNEWSGKGVKRGFSILLNNREKHHCVNQTGLKCWIHCWSGRWDSDLMHCNNSQQITCIFIWKLNHYLKNCQLIQL